MNVLSVSHVKKQYGKGQASSIALRDVSFETAKGEFLGIMGPSGSGKSTLLNVIATIDQVSSGSISIGGKSIAGLHEPALSDFRKEELGFVFQEYNLLDTLTLSENIALPLILARKDWREVEPKVITVAKKLGIESYLNKYPCQVSGGQRQRASAARAIVNRPKLVLADEPTGALDSNSSRDLLDCLQELNQKEEATILMVTHDAFAASFCSRILFIQDGNISTEITKKGTRKDFYQRILEIESEMGGDEHERC